MISKNLMRVVALSLVSLNFTLPGYANTYTETLYAEENLKSGAIPRVTVNVKGVNKNKGKITFSIKPGTASGHATIKAQISSGAGFLPNNTVILLQESNVKTNSGYYRYSGRFEADGYTYTATAVYDPDTESWTKTLVDQNGNDYTTGNWPNKNIKTIGTIETTKDIQFAIGQVDKYTSGTTHALGYFQSNVITTTDITTGEATVKETEVQTGDYVNASVSGNTLTISVNGKDTKFTPSSSSSMHYYHVNSIMTGTGSNYNNTGATGVDSLAAGVGTSASGILSSVAGSHSSVSGGTLENLGGVGATVYGAVNTVKVTKKFDGVANSVIGTLYIFGSWRLDLL